ncbi:MAG TPA: glycosyl hydrolase [Gemmatimonadaceae bacterium]|nr:glycosyl hydrolase [Gemmatimonadaceae bacterium]
MLPSRALALLALTVVIATLTAATPSRFAERGPGAQSPLDSALLRSYRWRNIGPDRGGRSIAVSGVRGRPREAYFGAVGGGLWKTTDAGDSWAPVTDGLIGSASVGAVAVSETNPDVVFIGTGETCIRGNIMPGDGVYRSGDAGKTWTHVGFRESHGISKIRIHPTNPDIIFVAAFGKYSAPSAERGVFKSTDGGKSWRKVLYRDDRTAAIDIAIDRTDPNVMYASMWEAYRTESHMSSGGPGSGLFKSTDGGEHWTEITRAPGMPAGVIGRIGVAISGANPKRVYALVENEKGGLFRSDDAGATWALVNEDRAIRQRAFYYTHVFADPRDTGVVYMQNTSMFRSSDGGRKTATIDNGTHGDFHDLWIDPDDPAHLVVGNDGGGAVSFNTGGRWTNEDFPTGQFYHVVTTKHVPYHVCGSQQDNSTLCTPYNWNAAAFGLGGDSRRGGGAARRDSGDITAGGMAVSYVAGGGEPGYIAPDPRNIDVFYSGTNNGAYVDRFDRRTGSSREVNPYPWFYSGEPASAIRERWQWTFPILFSPLDPKTLYVSSQRLWKTTDEGQTWEALSGDLTRHDPATMGHSGGPITGDMNGPEVYGTIFSVAPGKRDARVIWTGSDDGLVHVTRDGGRTWINVTPPAMPAFGRVSQIDASPFDAGAAYVSVRRPLLDDFAPYIFRTADYGRTWTKIVTGLRADAYVHAVRADAARRGLLYAATQHGVYISYDDGSSWQSLSLNLPDMPVVDLVVEGNELVIASHGRGFWVLDDIAALRQQTPASLASPAHLFTPPAGVRSGPGIAISWSLAKAPTALRLEIVDSAGAVLRTFEPDTAKPDSAASAASRRNRDTFLPATAGINRIVWDLRAQGITRFPKMILWGGGTNGPAVPPGRYTVRLVADGRTVSAPVTVTRNPWLSVSDAELRAQYAFSRRVRDRASEANQSVIGIRRVKAQLDDRLAQSKDGALAARGATLRTRASAVEEDIYQVRNQSGQDPLNFPIKVNNRLATLLSMAERGDGRPTSRMPEIFGILSTELAGYEARLAQVWRGELAATNAELARLGMPLLDPACAQVKGCAARP